MQPFLKTAVALTFLAAGPVLADERPRCVADRQGKLVCPPPDGRCLQDRYGEVVCSNSGGGITPDRYSELVCGPDLLTVSCSFVLLASHAVAAFAADTCALLPQADAAALLGQSAAQGMPAGPQRDEDTGGQLTYCSYRGAAAALVVSVVEFPSAAEARKQLTNALARDRADTDDAKVTEEPGVGEKAYYGVSAKGATYVFLKQDKVVAVGIGGKTARSKESLRRAALSVASKV